MAADAVTITTALVLLAGLVVREVVVFIVVLVFARLHRRATGAPPKLNELVDALIRARPDPLATRVLRRKNTQGRKRAAAQKASPRPTGPATPTKSTRPARPSPPSSPSRRRAGEQGAGEQGESY
jgi:hypothetical protein